MIGVSKVIGRDGEGKENVPGKGTEAVGLV